MICPVVSATNLINDPNMIYLCIKIVEQVVGITRSSIPIGGEPTVLL
jgi:hypothetical protein